MGRQTQLHSFPKDLNELLVAMHDKNLWKSLRGAGIQRRLSALPSFLKIQVAFHTA